LPRTFTLPYDVKSPSLARRIVEQFATDAGLDDTIADLTIIATELVTNAVLHGIEPIHLTVDALDGEITLEVADGDACTRNVRPRTVSAPTPGGRGLRIVSLLADRWGIRESQTGKTVWATVRTAHA
jgi:anti-sigma regulatory factor (Ser/Thr protein kinase)